MSFGSSETDFGQTPNLGGGLAFWHESSTSVINDVFRLKTDKTALFAGKVGIGTTSFNTNGGRLQVADGISFPATQSACSDANTLDDYEEGTWTPVWQSSGSLPTLSYQTQNGRYIKIGRVVHFWARIFMASWGLS